MTQPLFLEEVGANGVAWITLTRPDVHNAFNDQLIARLTRALEGLGSDDRVRAIVLAARGRSFSAGADLNWMKSMAAASEAENLEDAERLAALMKTLNRLPKPTVALVQGPAYGGGVGLAACCDLVLATEEATFSLSEVKLGLIPAVISPYVIEAIGIRAARRYFLSGERFSAWEAQRLGLVHEVVGVGELETRGRTLIDKLLVGGPSAQQAAKDLILSLDGRGLGDDVVAETARRIAAVRCSDEGREGIQAFLEKRRPAWVPD